MEIAMEVIKMSKNLDALINETSFEIVKNKIVDENEINKMLGVLSNDGVYAFWVYIKSKLNWKFASNKEEFQNMQLVSFLLHISELNELFSSPIITEEKIEKICSLQKEIDDKKEKIKKIKKSNRNKHEEIKNIEKDIRDKQKEQQEIFNEFFVKLSQNLNQLLFFREILEKILIYARYHAKAMGD